MVQLQARVKSWDSCSCFSLCAASLFREGKVATSERSSARNLKLFDSSGFMKGESWRLESVDGAKLLQRLWVVKATMAVDWLQGPSTAGGRRAWCLRRRNYTAAGKTKRGKTTFPPNLGILIVRCLFIYFPCRHLKAATTKYGGGELQRSNLVGW